MVWTNPAIVMQCGVLKTEKLFQVRVRNLNSPATERERSEQAIHFRQLVEETVEYTLVSGRLKVSINIELGSTSVCCSLDPIYVHLNLPFQLSYIALQLLSSDYHFPIKGCQPAPT